MQPGGLDLRITYLEIGGLNDNDVCSVKKKRGKREKQKGHSEEKTEIKPVPREALSSVIFGCTSAASGGKRHRQAG